MNKKIGIIIDTETAGSLGCPLVYDIGYSIIDSKGNLIKKGLNTVNRDILFKEKEKMMSAYYADKLPNYLYDLYVGERNHLNFYNIRKEILKDMEEYNIKFVVAHNASFDKRALDSTMKYLTHEKYPNFFPKRFVFEWWDSLKMAKDILKDKKSYISYCETNGFLTKKGNPQMTAEAIYSFLKKDPNFKEAHTAMRDVEIETEIFRYLVSCKKKMRRAL